MTRRRGGLPPEVRAFLDEERPIPAMPPAARARAMARARATMSTDALAPSLGDVPTSRRGAWVALICVISTAAVIAAYGLRAHTTRTIARAAVPPVTAIVPVLSVPRDSDALETFPPTAEEVHRAPGVRLPLPLSPADGLRDELRLLRQVQAAVARHDFAGALSPIAEHARRFGYGRLAEEREALHVKALVGLGRAEDAKSTAASFRRRFPHSVLLPAVREMLAVPR